MNKRTAHRFSSCGSLFLRYYGYVAGKNALKDI